MLKRSNTTNAEDQRRLDSWKEIGAFFGKDERTVKRWEAGRGLPVHRVPGNGRRMVYAYTSELENWLRSADQATNQFTDQAAGHTEDPSSVPSDLARSISIPSLEEEAPGLMPATEIPIAPPSDTRLVGVGTDPLASPEILDPSSARLFSRRGTSFFTAISLAVLMVLVIPAAVSYRIRSAATRVAAATSKHTPDSEAQEFYLKGQYYLQKRSAESLNQAVDNFTQAIVRDPAYAEAYAGLANCYNLLREYTLMPESEAYPRALAAAKQGLALDSSLAGAHSSLAFVDSYWLWDNSSAETEFKRAINLDPNSAPSHHWYATFLLHLGRYSEALAEIDRAQILDASSISILADKGLILFYAGHADQALGLLQQLETAEPSFLSPHSYLASIYLDKERYPEYLAEAAAAAALVHDADRATVIASGQIGYHKAGVQGMLLAMLQRQHILYAQGKLPAFPIAEIYARLGNQQEALAYIRIACKRRESGVLSLRIDQCLQSLHSNPEFRQLLAQSGLPQS